MCAPRRLLCSQENSGSIAQFLLVFHFKHSPSGAAQSASLVFSPKDWLGCLEWGGGLGKLILAKINIIWEGNWCNIMEWGGWPGRINTWQALYIWYVQKNCRKKCILYQEQIHMCRKGPLCIMQGKGWSNRQQYNIAPQTNTRKHQKPWVRDKFNSNIVSIYQYGSKIYLKYPIFWNQSNYWSPSLFWYHELNCAHVDLEMHNMKSHFFRALVVLSSPTIGLSVGKA